MVNIERLTPDGWKPSASQADLHAAVTYAKELCMEEPSTYRVLRNSDLICLVTVSYTHLTLPTILLV